MQMDGRKVVHDLVVLENVQDKILGIDLIWQHAPSYNALSDKCFWKTPPFYSGNLLTKEMIFIYALSSRKI
jgi:hypothetical protein